MKLKPGESGNPIPVQNAPKAGRFFGSLQTILQHLKVNGSAPSVVTIDLPKEKKPTQENAEYQELLHNLTPSFPNSSPRYEQEVHDFEMASRVAGRYRELKMGQAAIITNEQGIPMVSLILPPVFARELLDSHMMLRAQSIITKKPEDGIYGADSES